MWALVLEVLIMAALLLLLLLFLDESEVELVWRSERRQMILPSVSRDLLMQVLSLKRDVVIWTLEDGVDSVDVELLKLIISFFFREKIENFYI